MCVRVCACARVCMCAANALEGKRGNASSVWNQSPEFWWWILFQLDLGQQNVWKARYCTWPDLFMLMPSADSLVVRPNFLINICTPYNLHDSKFSFDGGVTRSTKCKYSHFCALLVHWQCRWWKRFPSKRWMCVMHFSVHGIVALQE